MSPPPKDKPPKPHPGHKPKPAKPPRAHKGKGARGHRDTPRLHEPKDGRR